MMVYIVGNMQLVWDQVGVLVVQVVLWYVVLFVLEFVCVVVQGKVIYVVDLVGEQVVLWFVEYQFVVEQYFMQGDVCFLGVQVGVSVGQQFVFFIYFVNVELLVFMVGDGVVWVKYYVGDWGIVVRVQMVFVDGGEKESDYVCIQCYYCF